MLDLADLSVVTALNTEGRNIGGDIHMPRAAFLPSGRVATIEGHGTTPGMLTLTMYDADGSLRWTSPSVSGGVAALGDAVVFTEAEYGDAVVVAVDAETAEVMWEHELRMPSPANVIVPAVDVLLFETESEVFAVSPPR